MRVVVALGGNALLRRGEPHDRREPARERRASLRGARSARAASTSWSISHGNGPQVGLLALQGAAYGKVETYPLDVLDAQTAGDDRLSDHAGAGQPAAVRQAARHAADDDRGRPAATPRSRTRPSRSARSTPRTRRGRSPAEKGWTFKPDGEHMRRVVPSPRRSGSSGSSRCEWLLEHGAVVICAGGGGIPIDLHRRDRACRAAADRRRGGDRQGPRQRVARRRPPRRRAADRHRRRRRLLGLGHARSRRAIRPATPANLTGSRVRRGIDGPEGQGGLPVRRADRRRRRDRLDRRRAGAARRHAGTTVVPTPTDPRSRGSGSRTRH